MKRAFLLLVLTLSACATSGLTDARYRALSPQARALFDTYQQFMTDAAQQTFLTAPSDDARRAQVAALHVEERLARYPANVRDAIWSREPAVGMDRSALFLALGRPDEVERFDRGPGAGARPYQVWRYRRGPGVAQDWVITVVDDRVTDVKAPDLK